MPSDLRTREIGNIPDVIRVVNQIRKTRTPRVLSRRKKPLAIPRPLNGKRKRATRAESRKDYEAVLASVGSWKNVDTDKLTEDIYES